MCGPPSFRRRDAKHRKDGLNGSPDCLVKRCRIGSRRFMLQRSRSGKEPDGEGERYCQVDDEPVRGNPVAYCEIQEPVSQPAPPAQGFTAMPPSHIQKDLVCHGVLAAVAQPFLECHVGSEAKGLGETRELAKIITWQNKILHVAA